MMRRPSAWRSSSTTRYSANPKIHVQSCSDPTLSSLSFATQREHHRPRRWLVGSLSGPFVFLPGGTGYHRVGLMTLLTITGVSTSLTRSSVNLVRLVWVAPLTVLASIAAVL